MTRQFSTAEVKILHDQLQRLEREEADKKQEQERRTEKRLEAQLRAMEEKRRKDYEQLPWVAKLADCWIFWCCTPSEDPNLGVVLCTLFFNFLLLSAVCYIILAISCVPRWLITGEWACSPP
jgi:hypothetical protein